MKQKTLFAIASLFISSIVFAQGYAIVGTSFLASRSTNNSLTIGAGYRFGPISTGVLTDFYGLDKAKTGNVIASFDIKARLIDKPTAPYISIQPGYNCYGKIINGTRIEGEWAFGSSMGVQSKTGEVGIDFSIGWQYLTYRTKSIITPSNSFRMALAIVL